MNRPTLATLCAVLMLAGVSAHAQQGRTVVTYTTGSGSATESDRSQAMDEATQNAQNWAASSCIGMVAQSETTSSNCIKLGSEDNNNVTYTCMVTVRDKCEMQTRNFLAAPADLSLR